MVDKLEKLADASRAGGERSLEVLGRLLEAARSEAVFSKPVKVGDAQVITASEVQVGLGFGFGLGSGPRILTNLSDGAADSEQESGMGSGGGGGGGAGARPIAVIAIREDEVRVTPIVDITKLALAFFTMLGSIFFMGAQIRKGK